MGGRADGEAEFLIPTAGNTIIAVSEDGDVFHSKIEVDPETFEANSQVGGKSGFGRVLVRVLNDANEETYQFGHDQPARLQGRSGHHFLGRHDWREDAADAL